VAPDPIQVGTAPCPLIAGTVTDTAPLAAVFFVVSALYASVGQAGGSAYLAAMAVLGVAPDLMKPTALSLNIIVSVITTIRFCRAGWFSWAVFWPFAVTSIPFGAVGGALSLPGSLYSTIIGLLLLFAAYRLFFYAPPPDPASRRAPLVLALVCGASIGFVAGLTGIGGGILLSPLLLFARWATPRQGAGVSAAFILVNSVAGLAGHMVVLGPLPTTIVPWAIAAALGAVFGSEAGLRGFAERTFRRLLAVALAVAGVKLLVTRH
jgi:uncharacterized protein